MVTPKPRQVRVDDDLWREFGEVADSLGTDRAKLLVAFMRRFVDAMAPVHRSGDADPAAGLPPSAT